jgi:hypothetical protein
MISEGGGKVEQRRRKEREGVSFAPKESSRSSPLRGKKRFHPQGDPN